MNEYAFDSLCISHKTPFGCLSPEQGCKIAIRCINQVQNDAKVFLEMRREDGYHLTIPMKREGEWLWTRFSLSQVGLYFYLFREELESRERWWGDGGNGNIIQNGNEWQISVIPFGMQAPLWCRGQVMYQIFPDRFHKSGNCDCTQKLTPYTIHASIKEQPLKGADANGNHNVDFFGGNLRGMEERLPYLASLGVGILYLNPIFLAHSNHRYDTADYRVIDPMLGNETDFISLCAAAHRMGMRVILDGVFSHVGADSIYFDRNRRFGGGAASDPSSPYRAWFHFDSYPDSYRCWWNIPTLPCVDEMNQSFIEHIIEGPDSVIAHWLRLGADGFRLDVADELPDAFIALLRKRMKEIKSDSFLIGEVWEDASNKISYGERRTYFVGEELDSVMNYPFRDLILSLIQKKCTISEFERGILTILDHYPPSVGCCLMNILATHDTPRLANMLGDMSEKVRNRARCSAILLQFTLPGIPCIYYGEEIGMSGGDDPDNRRYFDFEEADAELLAFYRRLSLIRRTRAVFVDGELAFIPYAGGIEWKRSKNGSSVHGRIVFDPKTCGAFPESGVLLTSREGAVSEYDFVLWEEEN